MKRGLIDTGLRAEFLHDTAGGPFERKLTLLWHDTSPHLVVFDFGTPQYVVDRDLFYDGLAAPAGVGDVRIWPWRACDGITVVSITTRTGRVETGSVSFLIPTGACLRFLSKTYAYTPADVDLTGNVDVFIASCLNGAAS